MSMTGSTAGAAICANTCRYRVMNPSATCYPRSKKPCAGSRRCRGAASSAPSHDSNCCWSSSGIWSTAPRKIVPPSWPPCAPARPRSSRPSVPSSWDRIRVCRLPRSANACFFLAISRANCWGIFARWRPTSAVWTRRHARPSPAAACRRGWYWIRCLAIRMSSTARMRGSPSAPSSSY